MRSVRLRELLVGEAPVLVATALADTIAGMLGAVARAVNAGADCVELRIDRLPDLSDVVALVRRVRSPHIVACRTARFGGFFEGSEAERIERLHAAVDAGATCVDIEYFADPPLRDRLVDAAHRSETPILIGYEDMQKTPPKQELIDGIRAIAGLAPDLVKLAVRTTSHEDLLDVLRTALEMRRLLDVPYAAIGLGAHGAASRPLACLLGASFTYCAVESGAAGQLTVAETRSVLQMVSEQRWSCSSN
jgi:3-dehydroquinate dehydratase-1